MTIQCFQPKKKLYDFTRYKMKILLKSTDIFFRLMKMKLIFIKYSVLGTVLEIFHKAEF